LNPFSLLITRNLLILWDSQNAKNAQSARFGHVQGTRKNGQSGSLWKPDIHACYLITLTRRNSVLFAWQSPTYSADTCIVAAGISREYSHRR
jgi:hypothetical protein